MLLKSLYVFRKCSYYESGFCFHSDGEDLSPGTEKKKLLECISSGHNVSWTSLPGNRRPAYADQHEDRPPAKDCDIA